MTDHRDYVAGARVFTVRVWHDEDRGWSAEDDYCGLSCDGGDSERDAIDCIVGSVYAALAYRDHPPRAVEFRVERYVASEHDGVSPENCLVHGRIAGADRVISDRNVLARRPMWGRR